MHLLASLVTAAIVMIQTMILVVTLPVKTAGVGIILNENVIVLNVIRGLMLLLLLKIVEIRNIKGVVDMVLVLLLRRGSLNHAIVQELIVLGVAPRGKPSVNALIVVMNNSNDLMTTLVLGSSHRKLGFNLLMANVWKIAVTVDRDREAVVRLVSLTYALLHQATTSHV